MALDQSQEHSIKFLKEDGRAKGLYGQQEEKVIELSKSEVLMAIDEFERSCFCDTNNKEFFEHPKSFAAEQNKFLNDLKALSNPVKGDSTSNLRNLNTYLWLS